MDVQYWYTEGRGSLVLVVVGDEDSHQDAGAPHLVTLAGRELDDQPSLPPGLQGQPGLELVQANIAKARSLLLCRETCRHNDLSTHSNLYWTFKRFQTFMRYDIPFLIEKAEFLE